MKKPYLLFASLLVVCLCAGCADAYPIQPNPSSTQQMSTGTAVVGRVTAEAYPGPQPTAASSHEFPTAYPAPKTIPPANQAPTVHPLTPVPPLGWPTDEPWPPSTSTPAPSLIAPTVAFFPTAAARKAASEEDAVYRLWFPSYAGENAKPVMEEIQINAQGYRARTPGNLMDVGMLEQPIYRDTSLYGLHAAPDGSRLALEIADQEMIFPHILDLSSGQLLPAFEFSGFEFYAWGAQAENFFGRTQEDVNAPRNTVAYVDLGAGAHERLTYSEWDGSTPEINALAVSPDGKSLAHAITYPQIAGGAHPNTAEIGITQLADGERQVICRMDQFWGAYPYSLKWSPDGQQLLWVASEASEHVTADQVKYWLWHADVSAGQCNKITRVRTGPGYYFPGGFFADWAPDSRSILFIQGMPEDNNNFAGNLFLLDIHTSQVSQITHYQGKTITFARFLPDSSRVAFSIRAGEYGEIWTVKRDGSDLYPIAGPTTLDAPFAWMKVQ